MVDDWIVGFQIWDWISDFVDNGGQFGILGLWTLGFTIYL